MENLPALIEKAEDDIRSMKEEIDSMYCTLGRRVYSFVSEHGDIPFCRETYADYSRRLSELERAEGERDILQKAVDKNRALSEKLASLDEERNSLRLNIAEYRKMAGAMIYEKYCAGSLDGEVMDTCSTLLEPVRQQCDALEGKKGIFMSFRLKQIKKKLVDSYSATTMLLEERNLLSAIKGEKFEAVSGSLESDVRELESLDGIRGEVDSVIREGKDASTLFDSMSQRCEVLKNEEESAAYAYGKALYLYLPDNVTGLQIGNDAIELIDSITLRRDELDRKDKEIKHLHNLVIADEISAKLRVDLQKIEQIDLQIQGYKEQRELLVMQAREKQERIKKLTQGDA